MPGLSTPIDQGSATAPPWPQSAGRRGERSHALATRWAHKQTAPGAARRANAPRAILLMTQQMTRAWMPGATWSSDSSTGATNAGSAGLNDDQHWLEHSGNRALARATPAPGGWGGRRWAEWIRVRSLRRHLAQNIQPLRLAVLDVGSNTVHLVVVDGQPDGTFVPVARERETLRLGAAALPAPLLP